MDSERPLEQIRREILEIVESPKYRPQKPKDFTKQLGLPDDDRSIVRRIIKRMVKDGRLAFGKSHLVHPVSSRTVSEDQDAGSPGGSESVGDTGADFDRAPKGYLGASLAKWGEDDITYGPAGGKRSVKTGKIAKSPGGKQATGKKSAHSQDGPSRSERLRDEFSREAHDKRIDAARDRDETPLPAHYLVGTFRRKPSGFGFVRLKNTDPDNPEPDLFIAPQDTGDAASGDSVAVELLRGRQIREERERQKRKRNEDDRPLGARGRILKVLKRATDRFVGTFFEQDGWGFVQVDAERFALPLVVGDPGATSARPGDKVVVEMITFPRGRRNGEAVIVEVLGKHGVPGLDTLLILREFGLPEQFSEEALAAARKEVHEFARLFPDDATATVGPLSTEDTQNTENSEITESPFSVPEGRYDATGELIVTIDPVDARDFDDAISLEKTPEGNWRLGVHIADVSHFVGEGGAIDREAKDRGTSVYLPDRVIPMLPEVLSNALASLQPGKRRLAKSVYIEFTPEGFRTDVEIRLSVIRSTQRFNYTEVQEFLDGPAAFTKKWRKDVRELLRRMHELAMLLRQKRIERGTVEMNMPEIKIDLDDDGQVVGAHEYPYYDSNRIIEEFMIAANEAVAEFLFRREILFLRRVHRIPSLRKMRAFADFVRSLELDDPDAEKLVEDRHLIQGILDKVKGKPEERAVNYSLLRSMHRAEYSPNGEGHYALASECYCHFTSPIRRYPDLTVHRLIEQVLAGKNPKPARGPLTLLGEHCSDRERRAETAENELVKLKLIGYLEKRIGMEMEGFVTGIEPYGLFVQGVEIPAEGLVRLETLNDDFYRYDRVAHTLNGSRVGNVFRLGDRVRIEVVRADADEREIDFRMIERVSRPRGAGPRKGTKPSSGKGAKTTTKNVKNRKTGKNTRGKRK